MTNKELKEQLANLEQENSALSQQVQRLQGEVTQVKASAYDKQVAMEQQVQTRESLIQEIAKVFKMKNGEIILDKAKEIAAKAGV